MLNGTYICEKHDNIMRWARRIANLASFDLDMADLEEIRDLARDIEAETLAAKADGQRMEDRLVARAAQGHAILALAAGLHNLSKRLAVAVPE